MSGRYRLAGHLDPVGKNVGFLVPMFVHRGANTLFTQRLAPDGTIRSFEEADIGGARLLQAAVAVSAAVGESAVWAFAFEQDDILADRLEAFRLRLHERIDDRRLAERPFLAMEVAEFLGMAKNRVKFAAAAFARIRERGSRPAQDWLDLSILTPDLRSLLDGSGGGLEAMTGGVVASVDGNRVTVRCAGYENRESIHAMLRDRIRQALDGLPDLYPPPKGGWRIEILWTEPARRSAPLAAIWFPITAHRDVPAVFEHGPGSRLVAYPADRVDSFREAISTPGTAGFVVLRGQDAWPAGAVDGPHADEVTTIKLAASSKGEFRLSSVPGRCIFTHHAAAGGSSKSPAALAVVVRQVVEAALAIGKGAPTGGDGAYLNFIRTSGSGPAPSVDALAALHDRARSMGISTVDPHLLEGPMRISDHDEGFQGWAAEALFPGAAAVRERYVRRELSRSRSDAAMLAPDAARGRGDRSAHIKAVHNILWRRGWEPRTSPRSTDETIVELEASSSLRYVRIGDDPGRDSGRWELRDLLQLDLSSVDTATVTWRAAASDILAELQARRWLAVNMRDLCAGRADGGIWSLLGAQVRRLSGGRPSLARTHFIAVIINHALRRELPDFEGSGALLDAIHGPAIGHDVHVHWNRVRQSAGSTLVHAELIRREPGRSGRTTILMPPFTIELSHAGVLVGGDQSA